MAPVRLALAQSGFAPASFAAALDRLDALAREAAAGGAQLLMLPETFLCGYGDAGAARALAVAAGDARHQALCSLAARHRLALLIGYAERAGASLYNAALLISAAGEPRLNARKMHLWGPFERATFTPGGRGAVAELTPGLRVGAVICYDVEHAPVVEDLARRGAALVLAISATTEGFDIVPRCVIPARAYENGVFVAFCNHAGMMNGLRFTGLSCVAAPDGAVIAVAPADEEAMLFAEIDPARLPGDGPDLHRSDRRLDLFPALLSLS